MNLDIWKSKEKDSADKRNQVVNAVNQNLPVLGGVGVTASVGVGGQGSTVSIDVTTRGRVMMQIGKVVATGPKGTEANYSDYRYWVQLYNNHITVTNHKENGVLDLKVIDASKFNGGETAIVTAYDASAFISGGHNIATDTIVYVAPIAIDIPDNADHVVARARYFVLGAAGGDSMGTDLGQVHIMVANNQDGWDYPFSVTTE